MRASRGLRWENKMYKQKRSIRFGPMPRRLAGEILYACSPFGVFIDIMTVTHLSVQIRWSRIEKFRLIAFQKNHVSQSFTLRKLECWKLR